MFTKRSGLLLAALMLIAILVAACQPQVVTQTLEVTRVVTETTVVEGEEVVVTSVVTEVQEVIVTATPEPVAAVEHKDPTPDTYVALVFGDIDTLDPNLAYDTASANVLENVMEGLVYYNHKDGTTYVPALASEVPTLENGGISADGLTYTFNIRQGVTFHNGNTLEPHDVAYTFWRGMLQSDPNGPQWLWIEPLLGYHSGDVTEEIGEGAFAGDPDGLKANADPAQLVATCEKVKASVVADDAAGTVTFTLPVAWGPFMATMANFSWTLDQEWAMENGAWDGDCATWQNFYAPGAENDELSGIVNGTGPYMLDHWTPGEEYVLVTNPNYWRTDEALWEGGPSGAPRIQTVIVRQVEEWGTRFAALQAGDAESVTVNNDVESQVDEFVGELCDWQTGECTANEENPEGPLRKYADLPTVSRTDVFLNFAVATDDEGNNPYIGSGQLDGNGVPADFFSDIHVRKAFNMCFDYETYIAEGLNGKGVRNNGPIIRDMLGYNEDGPMYEYSPEECAAELAQAWEGQLPQVGFRLQATFNTGNTVRQTVGEILQNEFLGVAAMHAEEFGVEGLSYQIEVVGLPWPTLLRSFRARQLPIAISGWIEDIHDPHNWAQPFTVGTFAGRQNLPEDLLAQFQVLVDAGAAAVDPAEREAIYFELQQLHHDTAIQITLAQSTGFRFEQRWVQDWFYRVGAFGSYYYAYGLDG